MWLFVVGILVLLAWLWWRHEHPGKIVRPSITAVAKRTPPLVLTRQSPGDFPRPVHDVLEAQIALARRAISPGSIDSALGSQTREAIAVFQELQNLPGTGRLDTNTCAQLTLDAPLLTGYTVTTNDLARLQPIGKTWLAKSEQTALDFETELELVAEKSHSNPKLIQLLNPGVNWGKRRAGHGPENSRRELSHADGQGRICNHPP